MRAKHYKNITGNYFGIFIASEEKGELYFIYILSSLEQNNNYLSKMPFLRGNENRKGDSAESPFPGWLVM
ncbi:MAG: hypothetical protein WBL21_00750 [Salinimicrobium sp.]